LSLPLAMASCHRCGNIRWTELHHDHDSKLIMKAASPLNWRFASCFQNQRITIPHPNGLMNNGWSEVDDVVTPRCCPYGAMNWNWIKRRMEQGIDKKPALHFTGVYGKATNKSTHCPHFKCYIFNKEVVCLYWSVTLVMSKVDVEIFIAV
jgi:hypothetical protein